MRNRRCTQRMLQTSGWTVGDLIRELQDFDPDSKVVFGIDYGDHCHTEQALPIEQAEAIPASRLSDTAYSNSGVCIRDEDDAGDEEHESIEQSDELPVVVLR